MQVNRGYNIHEQYDDELFGKTSLHARDSKRIMISQPGQTVNGQVSVHVSQLVEVFKQIREAQNNERKRSQNDRRDGETRLSG